MVDGVNKEVDLITGAHIAAENLRLEREKYEAVLKRMESFESRQILGGQTNAGVIMKPELTEEEKIKAENRSAFKGTVLEGMYK